MVPAHKQLAGAYLKLLADEAPLKGSLPAVYPALPHLLGAIPYYHIHVFAQEPEHQLLPQALSSWLPVTRILCPVSFTQRRGAQVVGFRICVPFP